MAFFSIGDRKKRPGVYVRITNIGKDAGMTIFAQGHVPGTGDGAGGGSVNMKILVSPEGVMYAEGPALSLGSGGDTVVIADAVNATVDGEMLVIKNSGA